MMRMLGNLLMSALGLALLAFAISFAASNDSVVSISLWPLQHAFTYARLACRAWRIWCRADYWQYCHVVAADRK